jgi:hypothetical protein
METRCCFVIAQFLGHTSARMTVRHTHSHPSNLRAAIDALPGRLSPNGLPAHLDEMTSAPVEINNVEFGEPADLCSSGLHTVSQ